MTTENLIDTIELTKKYEKFRVFRLWGIALIIFPSIILISLILFETWLFFGRHSEYFFPGILGAAIILQAIFFTRAFLSLKKLEIKEKKIVTSYYTKLVIAVIIVVFFYGLLFMIAELQELIEAPIVAYSRFPAILGGIVVEINGVMTQVYWGDNLALLIGYFLLKNKKEGIKLYELPIAVAFLTVFDILAVTLDPFVFELGILSDYFPYFFSIVTLICGIYTIFSANRYLKRQNIKDDTSIE